MLGNIEKKVNNEKVFLVRRRLNEIDRKGLEYLAETSVIRYGIKISFREEPTERGNKLIITYDSGGSNQRVVDYRLEMFLRYRELINQ